MVRRSGIGATSAAAVIFSVMLACNLVVFVASQNRATLYSQADASDLLGDEAAALTGAAATNLLVKTQGIISSGPMDCSSAAAAVSGRIANLSETQSSGSLTVGVEAKEVAAGSAPDNLSMVAPFNGTVDGDLSLALSVSISTGVPMAGVSIDRNVTHLVHLPVRWASALRDCLGTVSSVERTVALSQVSNCTTRAVGPLMASASSSPAASAMADGFNFGFAYSITGQNPCAVIFRVSVEQTSIEGPSGSFNVLLAGEGTASFA